MGVAPECGDNVVVNVDSELLPPIDGHDCADAPVPEGNPVVHVGVIDARLACAVPGFQIDVNVVGGTIDVGEVEITNDVGNPVPVSGTVSVVEPVSIDDNGGSITVDGAVNATDVTPAVERKVDGDAQSGAGSIVIPDGVYSFAVSVDVLGAGVSINGPDFAGAVPLFEGQSIGHAADAGHGNTLNGPITVTTTAGSEVNATWVKA